MRWVLVAAVLLALAVVAVWVLGARLPRDHVAACRVRLRARPADVFALLAGFDEYPAWRPDVKAVRHVEPIGGAPAYVEETRHGPQTYAVEERDPPHRLRLRVADERLPYGGTWTFELAPDGDGTALTVTEDGFVKPALFRFLARHVFGHHATMERYLRALTTRLGEDAEVERVEPTPRPLHG